MKNNISLAFFFILSILSMQSFAQYPDQQQTVLGVEALNENIESSSNIIAEASTNSIVLNSDAKDGYFILKPMSFDDFFNRGLPSWNGFAPENESSSFKIEMRFEMSYGWSRWITVGYWDNYIWSTYGYTTFTGGKISIDYVKLDSYIKNYQFKVTFKRNNLSYESPRIEQLSFFVSDLRSDNADINSIITQTPPEIRIATNFVYQYGVDDEIGGSICSPSTVSMIIQSYDIEVDTYDFAVRTKDPYWNLFGVWPRVVQHASEYGLRGTVTHYRDWNSAYEVLKNGGRIAMSLGKPLYSGHLVMLAGFDESGNPLVHNPARTSGYFLKHGKRELTESWFNKGGISYTFYSKEDATAIANQNLTNTANVEIFPNPFSEQANVILELTQNETVSLKIFNIQGQCIQIIKQNYFFTEGKHIIPINSEMESGIYILNLQTESGFVNRKFIKK